LGEKKLPTSNYKGTRDFYPEDMEFRNWMFSIMKKVVMGYGYREYDAPILESIDLYRAKSGQEIVEKQLYDFIDKGERHVVIRPEMTPTLARMVAAKVRELPKPIRWFSIPNLWRYEAPGHGRLREHWQLNVDIFGVNSIHAEVEIISLACDILFAFGAPKDSFRVKFSHRGILSSFLKTTLSLPPEKEQAVAKILDKKNKISPQEFEESLSEILENPAKQIPIIYKYLESRIETLEELGGIEKEPILAIQEFAEKTKNLGLSDSLEFDPSIIRGFDYYTGFIFEIFDTSIENKRSLYGGGRYDNLIGLFSSESLSGIGFGLGDVTLENFLRSHKLVPNFNQHRSIYIPLLQDGFISEVFSVAKEIRSIGINCEISLDGAQKLGKQIPNAEKKGYRYLLLMGEEEINKNSAILKDLKTSTQITLQRENLLVELQKVLGV
jgi:histidyl-tRNA synthetase